MWGGPLCSHAPIPRQCLTGSVHIWRMHLFSLELYYRNRRNSPYLMPCLEFVLDFL